MGNQHFWLWFSIEPIHLSTWNIHIYEERNMFVAEKFIRSFVEKYGKHTVYKSLYRIYILKEFYYYYYYYFISFLYF